MKRAKSMGVCALLAMIISLSLMGMAYATSTSYRVAIPSMGGHTNVGYSETKPNNNYVKNQCSETRDLIDGNTGNLNDRLWDFWVDQVGNGQVLNTETIERGETVTDAYDKSLTSGNVRARCSTRSLFDAELWVKGTINLDYNN